MGERSVHVHIFFLILLISSLVIVRVPFCQAQVTPDMYVDPPSTTVDFGSDFYVNVSVANVADLGGWEFKLYFGNNAISVTSATEGPFLQQGGLTVFFTVDITNNYNATHGRIWSTSALLGHVPGVTGSGTLATINFHASSGGNTTLSLVDTVLGDSQAQPIVHTTTDGNVQITGIIDIAVTAVTPLKTIVGQGYPMRINVTAENQGDQTETFNVTVYANTTTIETQTVNSMPNGTSAILAFIWNTTGFAKGNYTISAVATLPSDADPADNTFVDGKILVTITGDINGDQFVNAKDAVILGVAFGSKRGDIKYSPNADINGDDYCNAKDAVVLGSSFGQSWP